MSNHLALELDELEPPTLRPDHLVPELRAALEHAEHSERARRADTPHLGDCEKTSVVVELKSYDGKATVQCECMVSHVGDRVLFVAFQPDWRALASAVELDPYSEHTEGFIWTLAEQEFRRLGWAR